MSALRLRDADILLPRHRTARKERLRDTADRAGISPQYLSELERGMKDPSSEMLEAVAGALGKSSFELTRGAIRSWAPTSPATTTGTGGAVLMCAA
ncbi:helix-turn-helix domain-containing protein [Corynebacterium sp.]|uniref:helix-turn-helix domain-containing protein n=1 Tax=Corynebacterium sp. TaxID=1720 RepID=UPI00345CD47D